MAKLGIAPNLGYSMVYPQINVFFNVGSDVVEDEIHVLLYCSMYNRVRDQLFKHAAYINNTFMSLNDSENLLHSYTFNNIFLAVLSHCFIIIVHPIITSSYHLHVFTHCISHLHSLIM